MSEKFFDKMQKLKKVMVFLMVLDVVGLILTGTALFPMFQTLAGYGTLMLIVAGVIVAVMAAILLFEILAKIFLIRSTSPAFSWSTGRRGYVTSAKLLLLFNLGTALFNLLAVGGEGATLINQGRLYLQVLASVVEVVAVVIYLRTVKRYVTGIHKE